mmetsp:Transcript_14673/g.17076  ORF Transcript_14673/g.17076 Transcript_14673/m.17076 type:complete len:331 (-) Transcript_14673:239-1231(-)
MNLVILSSRFIQFVLLFQKASCFIPIKRFILTYEHTHSNEYSTFETFRSNNKNKDDDTNNHNSNDISRRIKRKLNGKIPIMSRTVPINVDDIPYITIWELQKPSKLMEMWWSADLDSASSVVSKEKIGDPFGVVMWPGSILASRVLAHHKTEVLNSTVLILGAGTGVEVQASAILGAKKVIATDISKLTLKLLRYGAEQAGLDKAIEPLYFDLYSNEKLPECDIVVAADVLYNEELAAQIGKRCVEVLSRPCPPKLIVTDSQRFHGTDFLEDVNAELLQLGLGTSSKLEWEYFNLENITGSGVLIEGDQTYNAKTRLVSIGWSNCGYAEN